MQTMNDHPTELTSLKNAARRLDISLRALYRLIAAGVLPRPVKIGGASKLFVSDLNQYLEGLKAKRD